MIETLNKVMQVQKQLLQELGHEPTPEEVANEMGLPLDEVKDHENGTATNFPAKPSWRQR